MLIGDHSIYDILKFNYQQRDNKKSISSEYPGLIVFKKHNDTDYKDCFFIKNITLSESKTCDINVAINNRVFICWITIETDKMLIPDIACLKKRNSDSVYFCNPLFENNDMKFSLCTTQLLETFISNNILDNESLAEQAKINKVVNFV